MDALKALVRKDIVLYFSNRRALLVTLAAPILIAAFFGSVLGGAPKKPTRVPVAGEDAPKSMFRTRAKKPEILVRYDPSQAMALPLVKGLLAEHVMGVVGRAAF